MFPNQKANPQSKGPAPKNKPEISRKDKPTDRGIPSGLADATQDDDAVHHASSIDRKAIQDLATRADQSVPDDDVNDDLVDSMSENDPEASTLADDPLRQQAAARTQPQMRKVKRLPGPAMTTEHAAAALSRKAPSLKGGEGWRP